MKNDIKILYGREDKITSVTVLFKDVNVFDGEEPSKGDGVGFFQDGTLVQVEFFSVKPEKDEQVLEFNDVVVKLTAKNKNVSIAVFNK